jgi:hypothetical protein
MLRLRFLGMAALGSILSGSTAEGGCPHLCELSVAPPVVEPVLPCLRMKSKAYTCNCGVEFEMSNVCQSDIQIPEGTFFACLNPSRSCTTIAPTQSATGEVLIKDLVPGVVSFAFTNQGEGYVASVAYDAAPANLPWYMCAIGSRRPSHPPPAFLCFLGAAWSALWIRRWSKAKTPGRGGRRP